MSSLPPNTELVALAWLAGVTGLSASQIATTLPEADSTGNYSWAGSGFVQVGAPVGGSPEVYVPMRRPVVGLGFWAVKAGSRRPPWWQAAHLGELVVAGCYDSTAHRTVTMPRAGYQRALVHSAYLVTEPRRAPGDQGNFARFIADLSLSWTAVPD